MNFQEFWLKLQMELKHTSHFKTKQGKEFKANLEYNLNGEPVVRIRPKSSGSERGAIPANEFEGVWDKIKTEPYASRFYKITKDLESYTTKNGNNGGSMQLSYIVPLIKHIVQDQDMH